MGLFFVRKIRPVFAQHDFSFEQTVYRQQQTVGCRTGQSAEEAR